MAYENYNFVAWSDGSPLSSNRLGQMSTNIEQVKDVVDDKAQGILKLNQAQAQFPNSTGYSGFTENEIIYLKDESGTGGSDRRVTIAENRYYRVAVNIPAISVLARGAEDSKYTIKIYEGTSLSDLNLLNIGFWEITPPIYGFYDVSSNPSTTTVSVKTTTYPTKIGAGLYSVIRTTSSSKEINKSFFVTVGRSVGSSSNNAPRWRIEANAASPLQFYVEDIGGI